MKGFASLLFCITAAFTVEGCRDASTDSSVAEEEAKPLSTPAPLAAEPQSQPVAGALLATRNRGWRYGFHAQWDGQAVTIRVGINTVPMDGVTLAQLMRVEQAWEARAEEVWDCAAAFQRASGEVYPLRVDIVFRQSPIDHTVLVRPRVGVPQQLSWGIGTQDWLVAHEIGHMIGAYDEYPGGGQDAAAPLVDEASIMTDWPTTGQARGRHFDVVATWFARQIGEPVTIVAAQSCS